MTKEKKKISQKLLLIIVVIAIVAVAIVVATQMKNKSGNPIIGDIFYDPNPSNSTIPYELFEPESLDRIVALESIDPTWNSLTSDYRPRWIDCTDEQYLQIFGKLPKFPQDFYKRYAMFMRGELTDYDRLGPEYWQQPEFFDMGQKLFSYYINRTIGMWTPGTVSCKPTVRQVEMKKGATVKLSTFFHTDVLGAEAYLGGIIYTELLDAAYAADGTVVFEQPANADSYISARIVEPANDAIYSSESFQDDLTGLYQNVGDDERLVLFYPTYSKMDNHGTKKILGFNEDWCYKVSVEITVSSNCPPGNYIVGVDLKNPSTSINQEYSWTISGEPYYGFYFPAIREWKPLCPFFQIIVTIL